MQSLQKFCVVTLIATSILVITGCPPKGQVQNKSAKLTVLLTTDDTVKSNTSIPKARVLGLDEILSLFVTVEDISLVVTNGGTPTTVSLISMPFDVDLVSLLGIRELLESVQVPVGTYVSAVLQLSNPMLELASDPGTILTNVSMPDSGLLQVPIGFEMVENSAGLLVLDLGAITVVELDAGGYELIPTLGVEIFDTSIEAQATGEIESINSANSTFVLEKHESSLVVDFSNATIFLPADFDTPSGTPADLAAGQDVFVFGLLNFDGSINASVIVIIDMQDDDHSEFEIKFDLISTGIDPDTSGEAEYEEEGGSKALKREFEVEVEDLSHVEAIIVVVDGEVVGEANVEMERAKLELETEGGDEVPVLTVDSVIEVLDADTEEVLLRAEGGVVHDDGEDHDGDDHDDDGDDEDDDDDK